MQIISEADGHVLFTELHSDWPDLVPPRAKSHRLSLQPGGDVVEFVIQADVGVPQPLR